MPALRGAGASPTRGEETISTEVPALLAGVRADRAVAMVADVSRAAATQLIAEGRVLVDGSPVSVGREMLRRGGHPDHSPSGGAGGGRGGGTRRALRGRLRRRRGGGRGQAGRAGGPSWCRARRGDPGRRSALPVPRSGRAGGRPGCARRTGPGSSTASTRARRACWPWPGPRRRTGRWSISWRPGPWSVATWLWSPAKWPTTGVRSKRPSDAPPAPRPRWRSPPQASRPAPASPSWSGEQGSSPPPSWSSRCRAEGPIRSGCTWRPSGTPWSGTPATACRTSTSDRGDSSCTPSSWASCTRSRERAASSPRQLPADLEAYLAR